MSEKIDWSKAPEWATHALEKLHEPDRNLVYWSFFVDGEHRVEPNGLWYHPDGYRIIQSRPTTPSWSGSGLPPVGVVCEYCCVNDKWRQVKVIAHMIEMQKDKPCAVSQLGDTGPLCIGGASSFRPIRTPEQIAADEREAAIEQMINDATNPMDDRMIFEKYPGDAFIRQLIGCLYNAGYRKQ